jgi:hypothetical protein
MFSQKEAFRMLEEEHILVLFTYLEEYEIPTRENFKILAKKLKNKEGIKSTHAHEILAKSYGFKTYNSYLALVSKIDEMLISCRQKKGC